MAVDQLVFLIHRQAVVGCAVFAKISVQYFDIIEAEGRFTIFAQAMRLTGLDKKIERVRDESYERSFIRELTVQGPLYRKALVDI